MPNFNHVDLTDLTETYNLIEARWRANQIELNNILFKGLFRPFDLEEQDAINGHLNPIFVSGSSLPDLIKATLLQHYKELDAIPLQIKYLACSNAPLVFIAMGYDSSRAIEMANNLAKTFDVLKDIYPDTRIGKYYDYLKRIQYRTASMPF